MLLGNYRVLYKSPGRWVGGGATGLGMDRSAFNGTAGQRNMFLGWNAFSRVYGHPMGYSYGAAFIVPQMAGGMASVNLLKGSSGNSFGIAGGRNAEATLEGHGTVANANMNLLLFLSADIVGTGAIDATINAIAPGASAMAGSSSMVADISAGVFITATLAGSSTLSAGIQSVLEASATLGGVGSFSAGITGKREISAALGGVATMAADIIAKAHAAGTLAGLSGTTFSITAHGNMVAVVAGMSDLDATIMAEGSLAASILASGDILSPDSLARAILDKVDGVELGLTVREALRIITSAVAGKMSGGGTMTLTFHSAGEGDKERIIATVDNNGNRTSIDLDPSA